MEYTLSGVLFAPVMELLFFRVIILRGEEIADLDE